MVLPFRTGRGIKWRLNSRRLVFSSCRSAPHRHGAWTSAVILLLLRRAARRPSGLAAKFRLLILSLRSTPPQSPLEQTSSCSCRSGLPPQHANTARAGDAGLATLVGSPLIPVAVQIIRPVPACRGLPDHP